MRERQGCKRITQHRAQPILTRRADTFAPRGGLQASIRIVSLSMLMNAKKLCLWIAIGLGSIACLALFAIVLATKILPLVIPDDPLADSHMLPSYVPVAAEDNPIPDLITAFERVRDGDEIDHSEEIQSLLDSPPTPDTHRRLNELFSADPRLAALASAADSSPANWRFPERIHHSEPVPTIPTISTLFSLKVAWCRWLAVEGFYTEAADQWEECLTIASGFLASDGGIVPFLIGLSFSSKILSPSDELEWHPLPHLRHDRDRLNRWQSLLAESDAILRDAPGLAFRRDYITFKSAILAGLPTTTGGETPPKGGSFKPNKTLNAITAELQRVIDAHGQPNDNAPLTRDNDGDRIDVGILSMAKAYLSGNAYGHVITAMSVPTVGPLPTQLNECLASVRLLSCACAAARFEIDRGVAPDSLGQLVEEGYIASIPQNPFDGSNLVIGTPLRGGWRILPWPLDPIGSDS